MNKETPQYFEEVLNILNKYLEAKNLRKTSERNTILEEIYNRNDHFDAEKLLSDITQKNYNISRATIYNTLELFLECGLVKKHQFGKNFAVYEKSFGYKQHDHLICTNCNKVFEFCDPRLQQIKQTMGEILHFKINHHSLNLFGDCLDPDCSEKIKALNNGN